MNETHGSSLHKLLLRIRLEEHGLLTKPSNSVLEIKDKLRKAPKALSALQRTPRIPPGPTRCQMINFRLAPLLHMEEGESSTQISDANAWTAVPSQGKAKFPEFPERFSNRQTWLRFMSKYEQIDEVEESHTYSVISSAHTPTISSHITSETCTPLPVFRTRSPTKMFLIRRPTIEKPIPLRENDALFEHFVKDVELKALPFERTADSFKFYQNHFQLILVKIPKKGERCTTPSRRTRTPESPMTVMINRNRAMNERIVELQFLTDELERETEDGEFVTELRSSVFNPASWSWNKIDVHGLKRRYTIDASLQQDAF